MGLFSVSVWVMRLVWCCLNALHLGSVLGMLLIFFNLHGLCCFRVGLGFASGFYCQILSLARVPLWYGRWPEPTASNPRANALHAGPARCQYSTARRFRGPALAVIQRRLVPQVPAQAAWACAADGGLGQFTNMALEFDHNGLKISWQNNATLCQWLLFRLVESIKQTQFQLHGPLHVPCS